MANSSVCCSVGREASVVHVINAWLKEFLRGHDVLRTISGAVRNGVAIPGRRSRSSRAVGVRSGGLSGGRNILAFVSYRLVIRIQIYILSSCLLFYAVS